jgi:hypothetical protein
VMRSVCRGSSLGRLRQRRLCIVQWWTAYGRNVRSCCTYLRGLLDQEGILLDDAGRAAVRSVPPFKLRKNFLIIPMLFGAFRPIASRLSSESRSIVQHFCLRVPFAGGTFVCASFPSFRIQVLPIPYMGRDLCSLWTGSCYRVPMFPRSVAVAVKRIRPTATRLLPFSPDRARVVLIPSLHFQRDQFIVRYVMNAVD